MHDLVVGAVDDAVGDPQDKEEPGAKGQPSGNVRHRDCYGAKNRTGASKRFLKLSAARTFLSLFAVCKQVLAVLGWSRCSFISRMRTTKRRSPTRDVSRTIAMQLPMSVEAFDMC